MNKVMGNTIRLIVVVVVIRRDVNRELEIVLLQNNMNVVHIKNKIREIFINISLLKLK